MSQTATRDPFADLPAGAALGTSQWVKITQNMIDQFGAVTLDPDPMHIDPNWASRNGPFGGTIAFGFLTVSLLTHLMHDATKAGPGSDVASGYYLNYGFDRLRLVAPVPVGARVRGHFWLIDRRKDEKGRMISRAKCEIEIEGGDRPALVAEWLSMWIPRAGA